MNNRLILFLALISLVFLIVLNFVNNKFYRQQALDMQKEKAMILVSTIAKSLDLPMNDGEMATVQEMLQTVGQLQHFKRIHLTDDTGLIRYSSNPWQINTVTGSDVIKQAIREKKVSEGFEYRDKDYIFTLAMPILNEHRCYSCHDDKKALLGILRVGIDWSPIQATLSGLLWRDVIVSVYFFITIVILSFLFQRLYSNAQKSYLHLKQAQEQLIKAEKMAAIGQMAAAISHDLRNPLTGIKMATYYLASKLNNAQPEITNILKDIELEIDYASNVVTNILTYSRPTELIYTRADIHKLIEDSLHFVALQNKEDNVKVVTEFDPAVPEVLIDAKQVKQVIINLFANAMQAMAQSGGSLTIRTRLQDKTVVIIISDTGVGVERKNLDRIFAPFFTTKARGVGLGLAIVHNIIRKHDGSIDVSSIVGTGTSFTIRLPIRSDVSEVKDVRNIKEIG